MSTKSSSASSVEELTFTGAKSLGDMPPLATGREDVIESESISTIATLVDEREAVLAEPLSDEEDEDNIEEECGEEWTRSWRRHQRTEEAAEQELSSWAETDNETEMIRKMIMLRQLFRIGAITRKQWKKQTSKMLVVFG
tara:strand:+ start:389 stop:808 length:420 start_codon:yes stop_codon:yes gene_type:complete